MTGRLGLDTNVALRWLSDDSAAPQQSDAAARALAGHDGTVFINAVVLAELIWLVSQTMKVGRAEQARLIRQLLDHPSVEFADRAAVEAALAAFETGGAGFVDYFIGALNKAAGCGTTLTFDKVAARSSDFTRLA